ncbi:MAG: hypothetical protein AMJ59_07495 [Gammaproteobacteria bacterium SG8_31]|jgi:hypothetical protein|nr:MAG: hypothetical protein AMJ59_07495 [Gammaproteobacteria bacterium SG8_31]
MTWILVPVSVGELLDKITVLEIKNERISDPIKLKNVRKELRELRRAWEASPYTGVDIDAYRSELKKVNETLWEIEDYLRVKEDEGSFNDQFIELARSEYRNRDKRTELMHLIDEQVGSEFTVEKSYPSYSAM